MNTAMTVLRRPVQHGILMVTRVTSIQQRRLQHD